MIDSLITVMVFFITFIGVPVCFLLAARLAWDLIIDRSNEGAKASRQAAGDQQASSIELNGSNCYYRLGRSSKCHFRINNPLVSLQHAEIRIKGNRVTIVDLKSSAGTYVNSRRISRPTVLCPGDFITLGSVWMVMSDDGRRLSLETSRGNITIQANSIGIAVSTGKKIVEGIDVVILPGELVGIMGPSGSGKSTLIAALNGYLPPTTGVVTINGRDLYENYDEFRGLIGYVPQDDIMHSDLTVFEALYYSARLRLPSDYGRDEIYARVRKVVTELGLEGTENTRIGDADRRGISGGQRKRVNVAMELITDPDLLFLDEPTSGLSSEDALSLMRLLRQLSDSGKTIVFTIHQPSLESYQLIDNLVVVGKDRLSSKAGRLVYFGPAYPDAIKFFDETSGARATPDVVLRGLGAQPVGEWLKIYKESFYFKRFLKSRLRDNKIQAHANPKKRQHAGGFVQYATLVERGLIIKIKDTWNTGVLLLQAPLIALLISLVFGPKLRQQVTVENFSDVSRAVATTLFLIGISALWFGCSNSARDIVAESAIFRRERMVCLGIPSYLASKFTILSLLSSFQCALLLFFVGFIGKLSGSWFVLYSSMFMVSIVGIALGLAVSAAARTADIAAGVLPLVILPMVILGGVLLPIHDLPRSPIPMNMIADAMPSRWVFESLLISESAAREVIDTSGMPPVIVSESEKRTTGKKYSGMAEAFFREEDHSGNIQKIPFVVMQVQSVALFVFVGALLKRRDVV
jgi:ABC transport system ATP-binding/permease protein